MKKSILLMVPFAMGLAACSGSSPLDKGNIITEAFMERNFTASIDVKEEAKVLEKVSMDLGEGIAPASAANLGDNWFLTTDGADKFGAYNFVSNKYDVPVGEYASDIEAISRGMDFLTYATVEGEEATRHFVDPYGNEVFAMKTDLEKEDLSGEYGADLDYDYLDEGQREGNEYMVYFAYSYFGLEEGQFAIYNLDGTISRKGKFSEFAAAVGSVYGTQYDTMAEFGHPEISRVASTTESGMRLAFYSTKEGKFISSIEMPAVTSGYVAGDYYVGQYVTEVEERATTYDYYEGGSKFNVHTVRFNYTNGAMEELESKVLFCVASGSPDESYVDEKGVTKYAYFEKVSVIGSDKALEPTVYGFMLDEKAEVVADVTGIDFANLEKIGDKYFSIEEVDYNLDDEPDYANLHVYDGKLNEVAYVPYVDLETGHVFQEYTGYGLVGFDGKVLLQPTALYIDPVMDENHFLVRLYDKTQLVDISEGEAKVVKEFAVEDYTFVVDNHYLPYYVGVQELYGQILLQAEVITEDVFWSYFYAYNLNHLKVGVVDNESGDAYFLDIASGELAAAEYGFAVTDTPISVYSSYTADWDVDAFVWQTAEGGYYAIRDSITYTYSFHDFEAK